jgi:hypothetical protein
MQLLLMTTAFALAACTSVTSARRPLTPAQLEDLSADVKGRNLRIQFNPAARISPLDLTKISLVTGSLHGTSEDGPHVVDLADIAELRWRSHARGALDGILLGVPIGAVIGGIVAAFIPCARDGSGSCSLKWFSALDGALLGLLVGPIVGAAIGHEQVIELH